MRRSLRKLGLRGLLRPSSRGVSAIEFGLAAPFLVLLLVGLIDLGLGVYDLLQVRHAVYAGAQYAMVHGWTNGGGDIKTAVLNATQLDVTFPPGSPSQVCGCPTGKDLDSDIVEIGAPIGGSCTSYTCQSCASYNGQPCTAGRYAAVDGLFVYTPILPLFSQMTLEGKAYGRMQ